MSNINLKGVICYPDIGRDILHRNCIHWPEESGANIMTWYSWPTVTTESGRGLSVDEIKIKLNIWPEATLMWFSCWSAGT